MKRTADEDAHGYVGLDDDVHAGDGHDVQSMSIRIRMVLMAGIQMMRVLMRVFMMRVMVSMMMMIVLRMMRLACAMMVVPK